jgi:hypothetical protein
MDGDVNILYNTYKNMEVSMYNLTRICFYLVVPDKWRGESPERKQGRAQAHASIAGRK